MLLNGNCCKQLTGVLQLLHQRRNLDYFLGHDSIEAPLAIQLGGNSIEDLGGVSSCLHYLRPKKLTKVS